MKYFTQVTDMRYVIILSVVSLFVFGCAGSTPKLDTPPPSGAVRSAVNEISPVEAKAKTQEAYAQFIDVRTPEEYNAGHPSRAINIPLSELAGKLDRLEKNEPVYVICQTGRRSKEASDILVKNGFPWVFNVVGGVSEWQAAELPMQPLTETK
jgi:rhodanese-related sulfurtransferase